MTLQLELPPQLERDLNRAAERDQISESDLALKVLSEYLQRAATNEESGTIGDEEWKKISQNIIDDNRELLLRLAK